MSLHLDRLPVLGRKLLRIAHLGEQNDDLMANPEMVVEIYPDSSWKALSYRNDYVGVYEEVEELHENARNRKEQEMQRFLL